MAKLLNILAASVGGGLLLGAGVVVGEALGNSVRHGGRRRVQVKPVNNEAEEGFDPLLANRLDRLEQRLSRVQEMRPPAAQNSHPEMESRLAGVIDRVQRQQNEIAALARQASHVSPAPNSAVNLRDEIRQQVSAELDDRLRAMEERLQLTVNDSQRETANAMLATLEQRIAPRIGQLEGEISEQAAALAELRDCSLKSERSVLRLVGVLERMSVPKAQAEGAPAASAHAADEIFSGRRSGSH